VPSILKPIYGQQAVARIWAGLFRTNQRPITFTLDEINGSPAILVWDEGRLVVVVSIAQSAEGIQEIFGLLNPEKLAYLQKQISVRGNAPESFDLSSISPDQP
jgi:RNA polymerase sigma-70 factor, ECF subfamily